MLWLYCISIMTAYLAVGCKLGDLCNVASIIESVKSENKVVIVAKQYADFLNGIDGIKCDKWGGDWHDLRGALKYAKQKYRKVVVVSTFGKDFPIRNRLPSFQLDQWHRGGALKDFLDSRLTVDRPKVEKIGGILLCLNSESSPFEHADDLVKTIKESFPSAKVEVAGQMGEFKDLLLKMDAADAVVCVESGPLHLSAATQTPVFALVTDKSTRWHGTAFHPRFRFHCRYSDYQNRKSEFIGLLKKALARETKQETHTINGLYPGAYNPSIIEHDGNLLVAYRWHPNNDSLSRIGIAELDIQTLKVRRNYPLELPKEIERFSIEDPRFFRFNGALNISYTAASFPMPPFRCVVQYGKIEKSNGQWFLRNAIQPKHGKNDFTSMEKNWVFFESSGKMFAAYDQNTVLELNGDKVVRTHKSASDTWAHGAVKGGCVLQRNGKMIRLFHSRDDSGQKPLYWFYRIGAAIMDSTPPFRITKITPEPIISGDEQFSTSKLWKPLVVFPSGIVGRGDDFLVSYGHNDVECRIAVLKENDLI